jgi:hypothetical protein
MSNIGPVTAQMPPQLANFLINHGDTSLLKNTRAL